MSKIVKAVQHEVVLASGLIIAVGEGVFTVLPQPWQATASAALPILVALVARTQTVPLAKVEQLVARIVADIRKKPEPVVTPIAAIVPADPPPPSPPSSAAA